MTFFKKKIIPVCAATTACVLLTACNQVTEAESGPLDEEGVVEAAVHMQLTASEGLREAMKDTFTPEQVSLLESAAHQVVISQNCDGFELDQEKAKAELAKLAQDSEGKELSLSADEKAALDAKIRTGFGMAIGSQLTISGYDHQAFCDHAREETPENPDAESGYILASSSPAN